MSFPHFRALIVHSESKKNVIAQDVAAFLEALDCNIVVHSCEKEALREHRSERFHLVFLPAIGLPDLAESVRGYIESFYPPAVVVYGERLQPRCQELMKFGVYSILDLSLKREALKLTLETTLRRLERYPPRPIPHTSSRKHKQIALIVKNKQMCQIRDLAKRLAPFATTVLITGESGTGKEVVARQIHTLSPRASKPFIAINCGAIPEALMESELFGHKKGAFTDASRDKRGLFEEADGGTLFLDEIGEMPLHLQVKLLRSLQDRRIRRVGDDELIPIDVRVVAATLRDLETDVLEGRFRDDLFYRLNVVTLHIPPLRERREEIPILAEHFIKKLNRRLSLAIEGIEEQALSTLCNYWWRGNVRELENCIERAMVLSESTHITYESLPPQLKENDSGNRNNHFDSVLPLDDLSIKKKGKELEILLISKALDETEGNRTKAAKLLEISHRALLYKLKEYGLG